MSDRQLLAEHGAGLCVAGLAAAGLSTAAAPVVPLAVLAAWGLDRFHATKTRRQRATIDNALKAIEKSNPDPRAMGPALALLKENRHKVAITAAQLSDAKKRGNFPDTLYDIVFAGVEVPKDDGVESLLRMVLTAAWQELRLEDDYNKVFVQESVTALERDLADGFARIEGSLTRIETRIDDMEAAINSVATANRDLLEALAARFRIPDAFDLPDATLRQELEKRAEDYRRILREIADLKGVSTRIDNIHAAAMDAVRNLRLAEARNLLRDTRTILRDERLRPVLEDNARLMEAEAEIELLDGDTEAAHSLLSAAADSFASIDPLEPARRRILHYSESLIDHGIRYGGTGLELSLRLLTPVLTAALRNADAWLWAAGMNVRATVLANEGVRTDGPAGAALLAEAVSVYRAALEVRTRADHSVDWAMTQNNLGAALDDLGSRVDGPAGAELLAEAVFAHRAALEVRTRTDHPEQWAITHNNLGNALANQGTRTDGPAGADLLAQAVTAYRAALEVHTRADHPVDWAGIQNNLGLVLAQQGTRTEGPAGAGHFAQAVSAHVGALKVYTRADHPVHWAATQNNLGNALRNQGSRTDGPAGTDLLTQAVSAYRAALEIRTRADHPMQWAMTQGNIAIGLLNRACHDSTSDPLPDLNAALAAVTDALKVFDPVHMSCDHAKATRLRDKIQAALDALP